MYFLLAFILTDIHNWYTYYVICISVMLMRETFFVDKCYHQRWNEQSLNVCCLPLPIFIVTWCRFVRRSSFSLWIVHSAADRLCIFAAADRMFDGSVIDWFGAFDCCTVNCESFVICLSHLLSFSCVDALRVIPAWSWSCHCTGNGG